MFFLRFACPFVCISWYWCGCRFNWSLDSDIVSISFRFNFEILLWTTAQLLAAGENQLYTLSGRDCSINATHTLSITRAALQSNTNEKKNPICLVAIDHVTMTAFFFYQWNKMDFFWSFIQYLLLIRNFLLGFQWFLRVFFSLQFRSVRCRWR